MEKHSENRPKKSCHSDKIRLFSLGIVLLLLASTLVLFSVTILKKGNTAVGHSSFVIAGAILVLGAIVLKKNYREIKNGHPLRDERSQGIMILAGYKAFFISIWWLLILSMISDAGGYIEFRDPSQALGAGILGMAIIFGISWFWASRKGEDNLNKYR